MQQQDEQAEPLAVIVEIGPVMVPGIRFVCPACGKPSQPIIDQRLMHAVTHRARVTGECGACGETLRLFAPLITGPNRHDRRAIGKTGGG